jgi:hypothetical protein
MQKIFLRIAGASKLKNCLPPLGWKSGLEQIRQYELAGKGSGWRVTQTERLIPARGSHETSAGEQSFACPEKENHPQNQQGPLRPAMAAPNLRQDNDRSREDTDDAENRKVNWSTGKREVGSHRQFHL